MIEEIRILVLFHRKDILNPRSCVYLSIRDVFFLPLGNHERLLSEAAPWVLIIEAGERGVRLQDG